MSKFAFGNLQRGYSADMHAVQNIFNMIVHYKIRLYYGYIVNIHMYIYDNSI